MPGAKASKKEKGKKVRIEENFTVHKPGKPEPKGIWACPEIPNYKSQTKEVL
jgi:hypothetical protein